MHVIGTTLGKYRVIEQIGAGGMATVYKAYQPGLDRNVAIKILPPEHALLPGFKERFLVEAKSVAQLSHPNILPIYDFGIDDDISYFVMKYVENRTLRDVLVEHLSFPTICRIIDQVASALDHAHDRGIIHRDIKPANILMERDWVLLTDFGIAKIMEGTNALTHTGQLVGTPVYMSPEQASGKTVDHRSDIYSLAIVLYQMITGRVPFEGETPYGVIFKHVHEALPLPRFHRKDLPEPAEMVLLKALAKNPEDRYQSAGLMAQALHAALDGAFDEKTRVAPLNMAGGAGLSQPEPSVSIKDRTYSDAEQETTASGIEQRTESSKVEPGKAGFSRLERYGLILAFLLFIAAGAALWIRMSSVPPAQVPEKTGNVTDKAKAPSGLSEGAQGNDRAVVPKVAIPVTLSTMQSNSGWTIVLEFADRDRIKDVFYRIDESSEFRNAGHAMTVNPETGLPRPNMHFDAGFLKTGEHRVEVKYRDLGSLEHGPYMLSFNTNNESAKFVRHILETTISSSWVSFDKKFIYFTTLLSYKYGLKEIRYSINEPNVSKKLPFVTSPGDSSVGISDKDLVYLELPKNTESVFVQVVYLDGTESEVKRFEYKK